MLSSMLKLNVHCNFHVPCREGWGTFFEVVLILLVKFTLRHEFEEEGN